MSKAGGKIVEKVMAGRDQGILGCLPLALADNSIINRVLSFEDDG